MASTTTTFQGISLQVTVFIAPKDVPRFWEAFRPVYDRVIAEPECTFFEVYHRSAEEEGVVSLSWVENWYIYIYIYIYLYAFLANGYGYLCGMQLI